MTITPQHFAIVTFILALSVIMFVELLLRKVRDPMKQMITVILGMPLIVLAFICTYVACVPL